MGSRSKHSSKHTKSEHPSWFTKHPNIANRRICDSSNTIGVTEGELFYTSYGKCFEAQNLLMFLHQEFISSEFPALGKLVGTDNPMYLPYEDLERLAEAVACFNREAATMGNKRRLTVDSFTARLFDGVLYNRDNDWMKKKWNDTLAEYCREKDNFVSAEIFSDTMGNVMKMSFLICSFQLKPDMCLRGYWVDNETLKDFQDKNVYPKLTGFLRSDLTLTIVDELIRKKLLEHISQWDSVRLDFFNTECCTKFEEIIMRNNVKDFVKKLYSSLKEGKPYHDDASDMSNSSDTAMIVDFDLDVDAMKYHRHLLFDSLPANYDFVQNPKIPDDFNSNKPYYSLKNIHLDCNDI